LRTQGLINPGGNPAAGYLLINEMRIHIDKRTQILNAHNVSIPITELKPKRWVYIETEKDPVLKIDRARKIYLLPRYINPQEVNRYPFMR